MTQLQITPVAGRIGAEIRGLTLSGALDDFVMDAIRAALVRYKVLFFRDQQALDDAGQEAFAGRLGTPFAHPTVRPVAGTRILLEFESKDGYASSSWHTDVTFIPAYPDASILRALIIPETGGDTLWANTATAYEELPHALKAMADCLRAIHTNNYDYSAIYPNAPKDQGEKDLALLAPVVFETEHPVVRVHPQSGERCLVLGHFFKQFVGLSGADSQRLFGILQEHITQPENTVRWRWRKGDVAIWDNRATQHRAIADFGLQHRHLRRATIAGTIAVGVGGVPSRAIKP
jgi:alpha-ketoglutarate-dependent taurine dioxygenase